jgi:hypothetical protein
VFLGDLAATTFQTVLWSLPQSGFIQNRTKKLKEKILNTKEKRIPA